VLPDTAIVLTDSLAGVWLDRLFPATASRLVRFPWGTGTLGFATPAAVGAKLARPDREVIALAGDGAFLFNAQELATALLYALKLTVVVFNDGMYSAVKHNLVAEYGRSTAHALANPDFQRLGEAFGMQAVRLPHPDALPQAVAEAVAGDRSTLIEVPLELHPPSDLYAHRVADRQSTSTSDLERLR
jgi:acetolactate synthase-1/2/3 large subunit